jgi:Domain of unknown function (DUF1906)
MKWALAFVLVGCGAPGGSGAGPDASDATTDASGSGSHTDASVDAPPRVIEILQGVDRAGAFSATEAHALKTSENVQWTGVYIGGACSAGSGWTKALLTTLAANESWTFMPTWVGQQSPSICGAHNLTAAQGQTDGIAAAAMMSNFGWAPNLDIPVALDLEAGSYTYSASARPHTRPHGATPCAAPDTSRISTRIQQRSTRCSTRT